MFLYLVFLVAGTDARRAASTKLLDDSAHTLHARDRTINDRRHQDSRTDHGKDHSSHDDHASVSADGDNRRQLQVVGHVKAFEAQMQYYVPLPVRNHPERTNLFIEPLGFAYNSSNRPIVLLQYHEHDTHWGTLAHCRGDTYPALTSCGPAFPNLRACWNPDLVDPDRVLLDPPVNCPKRNATAGLDPRTRKHISDGYDETCSHREDFIPRDAMALQMFEVKGAYVTDKGYVFNRTHRFVWPGCGRFNEWEVYKQFGEALIGIKYEDMRVLPLVAQDLFFVKTLYEPIAQTCGNPSKALWQSLRRTHLLHPRGLPLFRPDWSYHPPPPLSPQQAQALPPDWVVVLAKRPAKRRSISNFAEVEEVVERAFPNERIVKFTGSLSVLKARELFRRTRLFIAGHGAALTNLVFMPEKASVLEIRPDGCPVVCYNHLAHASSLVYHLVFSHVSITTFTTLLSLCTAAIVQHNNKRHRTSRIVRVITLSAPRRPHRNHGDALESVLPAAAAAANLVPKLAPAAPRDRWCVLSAGVSFYSEILMDSLTPVDPRTLRVPTRSPRGADVEATWRPRNSTLSLPLTLSPVSLPASSHPSFHAPPPPPFLPTRVAAVIIAASHLTSPVAASAAGTSVVRRLLRD
ncbi:unnamed protein product [Closterium sp. NIES-54]